MILSEHMKGIISFFKKSNRALVIIVIIAALLRFYNLQSNPPALTWDEASWGYNAYALGIDGRDEFGRFLPYDYLESFGDFKPPMYAYLTIIPVWVFGLSEFATRFASAFFGIATVLVTYFLVKEIFLDRRTTRNSTQNQAKSVALVSALLLAISPWHILLSRAAFEANVSTFFIAAGVCFFIKSARIKSWLFVVSAIFFVLSAYTFNTARIVSPLMIIVLAVGFRKELWEMKKQAILAGLVGMILILPIVPFLLSPQAKLRYNEVNIFSDTSIIERSNQEIVNDGGGLISRIIHNRRFYYGQEVAKHYFDHLSFNFLFIEGDRNPKFSTGNMGQMYLVELPFFITGILFLFRKRIGYWWVVPVWLVIGLIPASLARETPHALRTEAALPTFQIISALGVFVFLEWFRERRSILKIRARHVLLITAMAFFINILYFLHGYFRHYPRETSKEWQYGYKEAIAYVDSVEDEYDEIRSGRLLGRPYIYFLFYLKTNPQLFRQTAEIERDIFGFVNVKQFDKYYFGEGEVNEVPESELVLILEVPERIPDRNTKILEEFDSLDEEGAIAAYIFE